MLAVLLGGSGRSESLRKKEFSSKGENTGKNVGDCFLTTPKSPCEESKQTPGSGCNQNK